MLARLYLDPRREFSLSQLARLIKVSPKTVHHEVDRLEKAGFVRSRRVGNVRMVAARIDHRLARPLTELLLATYGPEPVLAELLGNVANVDEAYIYGSWAARHAGESGDMPNDVDVLVIGTADLDELDDAARAARAHLGFDVSIQRVSRDYWESDVSDEPFLAHLRSRPLVPIALDQDEVERRDR